MSQADVVAIIHTYAQDHELGSYMTELVKGFERAGVKLHLIITNHLVSNLGSTKLRFDISEDKIIQFIHKVNPAFVFTTNRGGITTRMMQDISCPIVTWMVDRIPFLHHGGGHNNLFCEKDYVITSSYENVKRLETIYPVLKGRVYFFPFATDIESFKKVPVKDKNINISFVGTYFYCGNLSKILEFYGESPVVVKGIVELAERVKQDYDLDFEFHLRDCGVECVLSDFSLDSFKFKGLLANAVSLNKRIQYLDSISDLGLMLYGTRNWMNVNQYSLSLLKCYQFGTFIKTREQLVALYQKSKLAVNISHHQAVNGLPYRVYDIMASNALLITEYKEDSDLFRLFGKDVPVPMYKNAQELRGLCKFYLEHEEERCKLVEKCNLLVNKGYSFDDRVRDFFKILELPRPSGHGQVIRVNARAEFGTFPSKLVGAGSTQSISNLNLKIFFVRFVKPLVPAKLWFWLRSLFK